MESTVVGTFILTQTAIAHLETAHGGEGSIIGKILNDTVARTTICAVQKWIQITAITLIKQLAEAIIANGNIRRDKRVGFSLDLAGPNFESVVLATKEFLSEHRPRDLMNARQRRMRASNRIHEGINVFARPGGFDSNSAGVVHDETCQPMGMG
jgi:hypothetical protein